MQISQSKTEILRRTNAEDIKVVWECIRNSKIQKQFATFEKLIKGVSKETNLNDESSKRLIVNVEADGLIERSNNQLIKSVNNLNGSLNNDIYFTLPDFSKPIEKSDKDWYCFICHLAGEMVSCESCFRSFHPNCFKENYYHKSNNRYINSRLLNKSSKSPDKFICYICELKADNQEQQFSRKQIRKLLDFATHFIRKKSAWKDMSTIGFRGEIVKNEYLVYCYCDLELIQRKIKDGRYNNLTELVDDADNFVHCVCILHGIYSDKADQARVLLREIKDEINEVQLCSDCYINAKAKLAEWITKPCQPNHKLIWAKQTGTQYFWPAKILIERNDGYEIRFFGGNHDRAFVKKHDTKSFHFRPEEIEIKPGSGFDRAWNEVKKLREKIEQGYYTHSSGESDLPPTEEEYTDEIYLTERRTSGLSITDHHLANGSNYSLLSSLSSRRSTALERSRKSTTVIPTTINGKIRNTTVASSSIVSNRSKISKNKRRLSSKSGGPMSKRTATSANNNADKSISSYKSTSGRSSKKRTNRNSDSDSDSSNVSDNNSDKSSSSSENIKSLNYKFSPKSSILRSPIISGPLTKSLRQNRKPSAKLSQLSASRYTSLSDRIKMDLSSTESSEFDPKEDRVSTRKRTRKRKYKGPSSVMSPVNTPNNKLSYSIPNKYSKRMVPTSSPLYASTIGSDLYSNAAGTISQLRRKAPTNNINNTTSSNIKASVVNRKKRKVPQRGQNSEKGGPTTSSSNSSINNSNVEEEVDDVDEDDDRTSRIGRHVSSNENTDRCCSPDNNSLLLATNTSPLFRSSSSVSSRHNNTKLSTNTSINTGKLAVNIPSNSPVGNSSKVTKGIAPADSTSNPIGQLNSNINNNNSSAPSSSSVSVSNNNNQSSQPTSTYPNTNNSNNQRQKVNPGFNTMFMNQPLPKRMVHKCVATTMPVCNCQEKYEKKVEEDKLKLQREHQLILTELEKKLKLEFENIKLSEIKKNTEEIKSQMQVLIDKEKSAAQEALVLAEAKHSEALTNTKRRQWCRNCLKEAIYHCCWNTSYCSIQCQQEHWQKEHKRVCRRKR